jgi:hypothetical protein
MSAASQILEELSMVRGGVWEVRGGHFRGCWPPRIGLPISASCRVGSCLRVIKRVMGTCRFKPQFLREGLEKLKGKWDFPLQKCTHRRYVLSASLHLYSKQHTVLMNLVKYEQRATPPTFSIIFFSQLTIFSWYFLGKFREKSHYLMNHGDFELSAIFETQSRSNFRRTLPADSLSC